MTLSYNDILWIPSVILWTTDVIAVFKKREELTTEYIKRAT